MPDSQILWIILPLLILIALAGLFTCIAACIMLFSSCKSENNRSISSEINLEKNYEKVRVINHDDK